MFRGCSYARLTGKMDTKYAKIRPKYTDSIIVFWKSHDTTSKNLTRAISYVFLVAHYKYRIHHWSSYEFRSKSVLEQNASG